MTASKPQVLTLGTFPDATTAELRRRFSVHHFLRIGHALDGLDAATARHIVALGSEANQGIDRALLAMLPKLEIVALFGVGALDVFENEPHVSPDLLALPNVIVQPHHGSAGLETRIAMGQLMIDNISAWLGERKLLTPVA